MAREHIGRNGERLTAQQFRNLQRRVATKKRNEFGNRPKRIVGGKERVGFNKERSNVATRSPKANAAYMQQFLDDDFDVFTDVDWNDEGWGFLAYH
jgi:hypothetical protein